MGELRHDPSVEEILASIKRIIAEDVTPAQSAPRIRRPVVEAVPDVIPEPVLELTEPAPAAEPHAAEPHPARPVAAAPPAADPAPAAVAMPTAAIVSDSVASASRQSLAALSAMVVRPEGGQFASLEDLVREMLRPMLKDWLDARLPELVERMVAREIARITGSSL